MKYSKDTIRIGTCSWNYSSWKGLVYSELKNTAAEYLVEYSKKYNTVEIDSWFYKIPDIHEVDSYVQAVDSDFKFSIKAPQKITQIMEYGKKERNKSFLSIDLYEQFYKRVEQIKNNVSAIMFEFEYMNKEKMSGQNEFIDKLTIFIDSIPRGINIGIECRNKNYLNKPFYQFLKENDLNVVLSEKIYMPSISDLIDQYSDLFSDLIIVRLLGGDRKEIEKKTSGQWDQIVEKKDIQTIGMKLGYLVNIGKHVTINVNNHYEGSAPLTIARLINEFQII